MNSTDEECGFTPRNYAKVLRCLLSPDGYERLAAERMLGMLVIFQEKDANGRWTGLLAEALPLVASDVDRFLAALIAATAIERDADRRRRMSSAASADDSPAVDWHVAELDDYPLERPVVRETRAVLWRDDVPRWLSGIGPAASGRVEQLVRLLDHPELAGNAFDALASIGTAAREAIPAMLAYQMKRSSHQIPDPMPDQLLRVAANETRFDSYLLDTLGDTPDSDTAIDAVCEVLWRMPQVEARSLDRLYALSQWTTSNAARSVLGWAGTRITRRQGGDATRWLDLARAYACSDEEVLRSAAAQMLRDEPATGFGDDIVLALARDAAPFVRTHAHRASASWRDPPRAAIDAAVADLGCDDGYDDEPGWAAASAIRAWKGAAACAIDGILAWASALPGKLERCEESNFALFELEAVIDGLGVHAKPLLPAVAAVAAYYRAQYDEREAADSATVEDVDAGETGESPRPAIAFDDEDGSPDVSGHEESDEFAQWQAQADAEQAETERILALSDPADLAPRVGIPFDQDVPGTPIRSDNDEDDGEHHVRARRLAERIAAL